MLKLTNTLTGQKELFTPITENHVGMYNCGPTVYDYPHIGNLRKYVIDDILRRTLELNNYTVNQVINVTDVGHLVSDADSGEDKIEKGAAREHKTVQEITKMYADAFFADLKDMNIKAADDKDDESKTPWATHHIQEQIDLIKKLEDKKYTYLTSDGVYFDTSRFGAYGNLGHIDIKNLKEGARVEANSEKKNPTDFALWKFSKPEDKRQQEWPSPWGTGFPGWHIECSAMSMKYLGESFDIHTGGIDHIPVHHNNEIAQSEAATGKKFVNYWIHENFLNIDNTKISKSLKNTYRLKDLKEKGISPLAYRYWLLTAHYQSPINFTWEAIQAAQNAYSKLLEHTKNLETAPVTPDSEYLAIFKGYINDDLDTAKGLALVWELLKDEEVAPSVKRATILKFDEVLGLNIATQVKNLETFSTAIPEKVQKLVQEREEARKNKDFKKSDELRDKIKELGYEIKDTSTGTTLNKN